MPNMIYKVLIIQIILNYEACTRDVHMTNISEVLGTDSIKLRCLYTKDPGDQVSGVNFFAINDSTETFIDIGESTVFVASPTKLQPYGEYLFGSANITKLSDFPSEVVLTFNGLKCKHERSYKCRLSVHNAVPTDSAPIQILVRVPPEKPDKVEIISTPMDVSTTTETTIVNTSKSSGTESVYTSTSSGTESVYTSTSSGTESVYTSTSSGKESVFTTSSSGTKSVYTSTSSGTESVFTTSSSGTESVYTSKPSGTESVYSSTPPGTERLNTSTPPGTEHSTVITSPRSDKNHTTSLYNFGSPIVDNNITSTTNSFYNSTSGNEPTTVSSIIMEGNNITVRCSGNVGKPSGIFIFKKFRKDHKPSIDYNATTTETEKIQKNCSYYRTSYLIFQVTAEDNQAVIRCVVVSPLAEQDMYIDSEKLEIKYNVRMPTVTKHPEKQEYIVGEDTSITLTCTTDGNPKPIYHWYKDNQYDSISSAENFTLQNISTTDSGLYICNVSNTINGLTYTDTAQMEIHILNKADKSTTQSTSTDSSSGADDTHEKSSGDLADKSTTQSTSTDSSSGADDTHENSSGDLADKSTTQSTSTDSSSGADDTNENSSGDLGSVIGGVLGAAVSLIVIIVITYCVYKKRKKTKEIPLLKNESQVGDGSKSKPIAESMTGSFEYIALEEDANKTQRVYNGHEVEEIGEHNKEYLKKQGEEEQKMKESNSLPQPAAYGQVNEATKSKNKQNTETPELADKQEEDKNVESQEGTNDEAGEKGNEKNEHFDTSNNSSKQNSDGDTKLSKQTSKIESYNNQAFEKDENRKVAAVSPTIRSSGGSQDNEQTNQNRHSQSKEGYENVIAKDQTDISEGEKSHRTAL